MPDITNVSCLLMGFGSVLLLINLVIAKTAIKNISEVIFQEHKNVRFFFRFHQFFVLFLLTGYICLIYTTFHHIQFSRDLVLGILSLSGAIFLLVGLIFQRNSISNIETNITRITEFNKATEIERNRLAKTNEQLKREIKERKRAQEDLLESEKRYRLIAENATDVIWTLDLDSLCYTYFSPSVERARGYTPKEAMTLSVEQSVTPDSFEKGLNILNEEMEKEKTGEIDPDRSRAFEVEQYCKDGSTIWVEVKMKFLRDEQGNPIGVLGASRDITSRKKAETALRKNQEKYRNLVENLNDVIYAVDRDGNFSFVNQAIENISGYTPEELVGNSFRNFIHHDFLSVLEEQLGDILTGKDKGHEFKVIKKNGDELWVSSSFKPIYEKRKIHGVRGILKDITERKHAEEQLLQFEKMAALGSLVAGIAHEINTPLGVGITASSFLEDSTMKFLELFKKDQLKHSDLDKFMEITGESSAIILSNLKRAADLINSFKQVAVDQSSGEFRNFDLKTYLGEIFLSLQPEFKRTHHTITVKCKENIEIYSAPGALFQILSNLVINSLTHGFEEIKEGNIILDISHDQEKLNLSYTDDGRGMDKKTLKKLYDPFFTTNRQHGGTGLGMHIVYNIVTQKLRGQIQCKSTPGKGVFFLITIPINHSLISSKT